MASTSDNTGFLRNEGFDSPLPQWVTKGSKSTPTSPLGTFDTNLDEVNNKSHHHHAMPTNSPVVAHRQTTKMGVPMTMFQPMDHSLTIRPMPLPLPVAPPTLNFEAPSLSSTPRGFVTLTPVPSKKRYSYSGPLTSSTKSLRSHASVVPSSGPLLPSTAKSRQPPGSPYGGRAHSPSSPASSPSQISPPQIRELHKLPPPPLSGSSSPIALSSGMIPHSAPLYRRESKHLHAKTWT
jgi:hypothetical protein